MERVFTYFSIKFDNLYLKWNFLQIWLWKWKKWILFYERSPSQIILIENTKLFFFFVYIYNLSNKKCVYIIKKRTYVYIYMCVEVVLINVLASHLAPPNKNSWLRPCTCAPVHTHTHIYIKREREREREYHHNHIMLFLAQHEEQEKRGRV